MDGQNQTVAPQPQAVPQPGAPKLQLETKYLSGITVFSVVPVFLQLTADNRFQAFLQDKNTGQYSLLLCDLTPAQVISVSKSMNMLLVKIPGKTYRFTYGQGKMSAGLAVGGLIGMTVVSQQLKNTPFNQWVEAMQQSGFIVSNSKFVGKVEKYYEHPIKNTFKWTGILFVVVIIPIVIISVIVSAIATK